MAQYSKLARVLLNEIEADVRAAIQIIKDSDLDEAIKTAKLECYETDMLGYIVELKKEYEGGVNGEAFDEFAERFLKALKIEGIDESGEGLVSVADIRKALKIVQAKEEQKWKSL